MSGPGFQSLLAVAVVLALVVALAWLVRRGAFAALRQNTRGISVETAVPIGERRSLIIVAVEGRRLLLGLTSGQISMLTELDPAPVPDPNDSSLTGAAAPFEQQLLSRITGVFRSRS